MKFRAYKNVFYSIKDYASRKIRNNQIVSMTQEHRAYNVIRNIFSYWAGYCPMSKRTKDNSFRAMIFMTQNYKYKAFQSLIIHTEHKKESKFKKSALMNYYLNKRIEIAFKNWVTFKNRMHYKKQFYYMLDMRRFKQILMKSYIILKTYTRYNEIKKKAYTKEKQKLVLVSNKRWLKSWYKQVFKRAIVRTFDFKMRKIISKIFFRKVKDLKYSDYRKMVYIQENSINHTKNQFLKEWRRHVAYKKDCLAKYFIIRKNTDTNLIKKIGKVWLNQTKNIITSIVNFKKALIEVRKNYLIKYIEAWKYRIRIKKVPEKLQAKRTYFAKIQIFND